MTTSSFSLKEAINAYNFGDYPRALAHFQALSQTGQGDWIQVQAQKYLVKVYRKLEMKEEAISLCRSFLTHPVYAAWAVSTLKKLGENVDGNGDYNQTEDMISEISEISAIPLEQEPDNQGFLSKIQILFQKSKQFLLKPVF